MVGEVFVALSAGCVVFTDGVEVTGAGVDESAGCAGCRGEEAIELEGTGNGAGGALVGGCGWLSDTCETTDSGG